MDRPALPRLTLTAALTAATVALAGLAAPAAQAADLNVAKNAGFESGLSNWACSAGSGATVSSPVRGGAAALKATPGGQDNARCAQTVAVKPGATYTLSAWVQGGYAYLGASGTGTTDVSTWTPGSSGWKQLTTSFKAGPSTTSVTVYTHGWYGQSAYYVDDVSVFGPDGGGGTDPEPGIPAAPAGLTVAPRRRRPSRSRGPASAAHRLQRLPRWYEGAVRERDLRDRLGAGGGHRVRLPGHRHQLRRRVRQVRVRSGAGPPPAAATPGPARRCPSTR